MGNDARSDDLPKLLDSQKMFRGIPGSVRAPVPYHFVVDTSHVVGAIRYKVRQANPTVRVHLEEIISAGLVIAYAPFCIEEQVERNLVRLSKEEGLPLDSMRQAWVGIRSLLHLAPTDAVVPPELGRLNERDSTDLPFCQVYGDVAADALLSGDKDYEDAPVRVLDRADVHSGLGRLRTLGRFKAREAQSRLTTNAAILVGSVGTVKLLKAFWRLPWWLRLIPLVGGVVFLLDDDRRAKTAEALGRLGQKLRPVGERLAEAFQEAEETAKASEIVEGEIGRILPAPRHPPPEIAAYRLLLLTKQALTLAEIEQALRLQGYGKDEPGFRTFVRRSLAAHPRLIQGHERRWSLRTQSSHVAA